MIDDPDKTKAPEPDEAKATDEAKEMERAQEDAAKEREENPGYQ